MRVPSDLSPTDNDSTAFGRVRPRGRRWRVLALALVALVVVVSGLLVFWMQTRPRELSSHMPPYLFTWSGDAPGMLTAQEAYQREARVTYMSDGAVTTPVATLWIAESSNAALALAQLAPDTPDAHHLALVMLERTGGSNGVWRGSGGNLIFGVNCTATSDYCIQQTMWTANPAAAISDLWLWGTTSGAQGLAVQFNAPLTQPAQGGMLAGTTYYATSHAPVSGGSATLIVIGTGNQVTVNAAADWIARNAPRRESGPPNG